MALIGRTIYPDFNTYHPKTGVATVADSTPSYSVYKNDSGTPLSLSGNSIAVRSGTTSNYVITLPLTVGNGFTHGDTFILKVSVTVAGITKIVTLLTFIATTYEADSIVQGSDNKVLLSNNAHTGATIPTVTTVTNDVGITQAGADKAWSTATRVLTAGTNIALAKGTGVTGFNDISTTDVATAVWNAATATYGTAGSYGLLVETNLDAAVSSITVPTTGAIADAVWNEAIADHLGAGSTGLALNSASSAGDPWSTAVPGAYGAGTAGYILGTNLNTTVSSRSTHSAADVWSVATRVLTAGTNIALAKGTGVTGFNDISTTDVATAVWNAATATYGTAGSYGLLVETNLDAAVSSITVPTTGAIADAVWNEAIADHLGAGSTGLALNSASSAGDPWSTAVPGAYGAGTAGYILGTNLNTTVSSRSTHSAADVWSVATRVLTAGTNIALAKGTGVTGFNDISTTDVATAVWNAATATYGTAGSYGLLVETNLDAAVSSITVPTTGAIADAVWNEAIADHLGAGSTGLALNSASSAGDPWSTAVPGAYGAGTAGYILGTNLNTTVSSRSTHSAADVWSVATRVLTAGTNIALAKGTGVTGFNDVSTTDVATAVWNAATATYGTAGSYGLLVETNLDAAVSSKASQASVNDIPINPLLTNDSRLNNLDTTIGSRLASASYIAPDNSSITAIKLKTDNIQWGDITDIKDEALGKWVLDPDLNTLTLYRQDGVTILKTFSLTSTTQIVPAYIQRT